MRIRDDEAKPVIVEQGSPQDCPLRFPGQYHHTDTNLYYNRFRDYDPAQGQYTSQDPIGLLGGLHPYAYVLNPTAWIDPLGLAGCKRGNLKPIVLGETMEIRVKPVAKELSAHTFNPRGKNPDFWERNQQQWIRRQITSGRPIFDIGIHRGRIGGRSVYYEIERSTLERSGYSRQFVKYVSVKIESDKGIVSKTFRLYKWQIN